MAEGMFGQRCPECEVGTVVRKIMPSYEIYSCSAECGWWAPYEEDLSAT